ncbi:MAG: hypothetical protein ABIH09_05735, partial [Candidatus Omnitrophota bacterium]
VDKILQIIKKDKRFAGKVDQDQRKMANEIYNTKIRFVEADIKDMKHLNTVIDLVLDLAMVECDRYGKLDGYQDQPLPPKELQDRFLQLLQLSVTNYHKLISTVSDANTNTIDIKRLVLNIFRGGESGMLCIKRIDWNELPEWKRAQDQILMAL